MEDTEKLKSILQDTPRGPDFLAEYLRELKLHRHEEDTFRRLAFRNADPGGAFRGSDRFVVSVFSEMYEPLSPAQKLEIRRWWHEMVHGEALAVATPAP
jgi:hypothetical protein